MTALIVCASKALGNTQRIAEEMAGVLDARVVTPEAVTDGEIEAADLVGWGSGIYWMSFARELVDRIDRLDSRPRGRSFVFATSGLPETPLRRYTRSLTGLLSERGFESAGVYTCRGHDTMGPLALVGGLNRGSPTAADIAGAADFARGLRR